MENKSERLKWFQANLEDKHPGLSLEELSLSFRLDPEVFRNKIENGQEFDSMAGSVIKGFLGCGLNEFVEGGRAVCAEGSRPAVSARTAPAGTQRDILADVQAILDRGGEKAQALRTIIALMSK